VFETRVLGEERQTALGGVLAGLIEPPCIIYLSGELGAGKTTLVRGLLRGYGHTDRVKSPTYTLLEPYQLSDRQCYHLDLYRLADPEELVFLGLEDLLQPDALLLVEWPERGHGILPAPDLSVEITHQGKQRRLIFQAGSEKGIQIINNLQSVWEDG
jgi:tRNA threonylcarbamoyladenosine biosynthesis protein TsaE